MTIRGGTLTLLILVVILAHAPTTTAQIDRASGKGGSERRQAKSALSTSYDQAWVDRYLYLDNLRMQGPNYSLQYGFVFGQQCIALELDVVGQAVYTLDCSGNIKLAKGWTVKRGSRCVDALSRYFFTYKHSDKADYELACDDKLDKLFDLFALADRPTQFSCGPGCVAMYGSFTPYREKKKK